MKAPTKFVKIINRKRYDVSKATLIADDEYWDGHNMERHGRNTFLYRTPKGEYFVVTRTMWQDECDTLEPVPEDEAIELYESLPEHKVEFSEAFPNVEVVDA